MNSLHLASRADVLAAPREARRLCLSWAALAACRAAGIPASPWDESFPAARAKEAEARSLFAAKNWYRRPGADDPTVVDGLSLGRSLEWLAWILILKPSFKFLGALNAAFEESRPQIVYCDDDLAPPRRALIEALQIKFGFELRWLAGPPSGQLADRWNPPSLDVSSSKLAVFRALNLAASAARMIRGAARDGGLVVSYYRSLQPVLDELARRGGVAEIGDGAPRSALARLARLGCRFWSAGTPLDARAETEAAAVEMAAEIRNRLASGALDETLAWDGVSLRRSVEAELGSLAEQNLPSLSRLARGLEREWDRQRPRLVVVPYSGLPRQSLLLQLARRKGRPSVMLLHGLPISYDLPIEGGTTHLAAWTPEQIGLYKGAAGEDRTLLSAGNPYFDGYKNMPKASASGPIRRVLVLTSPENTYSFLSSELAGEIQADAMLRVLAETSGCESTLKLHPSELEERYRGITSSIVSRARLSRTEPIQDCLRNHDLVIGGYSTVLLEAMLAGLPVICVNFGREAHPAPFDGASMPVARTPAQLRTWIVLARDYPDGLRRDLFKTYDDVLRRFAGPIDGTASARVAEALDRLARE